MDEERVRCPYCKEWIVVGASKCRYCGEWLSAGTQLPLPEVGNEINTKAEVLITDSCSADQDRSDRQTNDYVRESVADSKPPISDRFNVPDGGWLFSSPQDQVALGAAALHSAREKAQMYGFVSILFAGYTFYFAHNVSGLFQISTMNLVGGLLAIEGVWLMASPLGLCAILNGLTLIVVAMINTAFYLTMSRNHTNYFFFLPFLQFGLASRCLRVSKLLRSLPKDKPLDSDIERVKKLAQAIETGKDSSPETYIEFADNPFFQISSSKYYYKALLFGDGIAAKDKRGYVWFATMENTEFKRIGKEAGDKPFNAKFRIGQFQGKCQISPQYFARYERWRSG